MPYANVCSRPGEVLDPGDKTLEEAQREAELVPGVRLQWSREASHVQLAVQTMSWGSDGNTTQPMIEGGDERNQQQLWATVNRHEINLLIKRLREARDQSFGRDE